MINKFEMLNTLLTTIAGILIFISISHWFDFNGYTAYSPIMIIVGLLLLFYPHIILNRAKAFSFITKHLLKTIGHILVFVGTKIFIFDRFLAEAWLIYLILGIILLNKHKEIAEAIFKS
jgi:hypothetical protein